ncbi:MAG: hypothetical protein LLG93_11170 [Deltaproteobacteria bacterium]|nr:hypothetical protein [Deltaproteobacteria bacterium]
MSETVKTLLLVLLTICAFILALRFAAWKVKRACQFIIRDLTQKGAFDPASAVTLPYSQSSLFRLGMKDYRPRALQQLVQHDVVRQLEGGRYYLCEGVRPDFLDGGKAA